MNHATVLVRELAGWGFDDYEYRPEASRAHTGSPVRHFSQQSAHLRSESERHLDALQAHASRPELLDEMKGLEWSLGVVDLRELLAFQRRLVLNPKAPQRSAPQADSWPELIDFCFPRPQTVFCDSIRREDNRLFLSSENPNIHARICSDTAAPIQLHGGSPFVEVAQYRGRWFLRDGYHRAYTLMKSGVHRVPAVIVQTKTLEELGATKPWFFGEEVLLSSHPPHVSDFLDDLLTIQYGRVPLVKTIRITIDETLTPASSTGESS